MQQNYLHEEDMADEDRKEAVQEYLKMHSKRDDADPKGKESPGKPQVFQPNYPVMSQAEAQQKMMLEQQRMQLEMMQEQTRIMQELIN